MSRTSVEEMWSLLLIWQRRLFMPRSHQTVHVLATAVHQRYARLLRIRIVLLEVDFSWIHTPLLLGTVIMMFTFDGNPYTISRLPRNGSPLNQVCQQETGYENIVGCEQSVVFLLLVSCRHPRSRIRPIFPRSLVYTD